MIEGHGDDTYRYPGITSDFSSNICLPPHRHEMLMAHLAARSELILHYPEPEAWSLEEMIAERHGIDPACVIVTSGATEAIYLIAQTFRYKPVIPTPTFSEYEEACKLVAHASQRGSVGEAADCHAEKRDLLTMLWLCNPNNPDGKVYDLDNIHRMMHEYDLVVLDHSYENYTNVPVIATQWGCREPRTIVIHSFTKTYAIPGLRLGYITAHEKLIDELRRFIHPWSISALAVEAGKFLLKHDELICHPDLTVAQRLRKQLLSVGIDVQPTHTNFMLCRLPVVGNASERCNPDSRVLGNASERCDNQQAVTLGSVAHYTAAGLKEYLAREHRMLIRDASNFRGLTSQHFRVAAQSPEENDVLVTAIQEYLKRKTP